MLRQRSFSVVAALTVIAGIRNAVAGSCEEVWFVEGSFLGDTFTCGDRIVYLQTPQGGGKTEQEARVQASLEELKCADCWPWEKYRQDGETERSPKRGIAIENNRLTSEALSGLSQVISWGVTWDYKLEGTDGPDLSVWKMAGVDFVPLIWGAGTIELAEANGLPDGSKALLGFNEPNFPNQANLDPYTAARHWKDIEQLAEDNDISTIVSPSMNYHESMDPIEWLEQFLAYCEGCKVDAIGIHVFTCYAGGLKYHLDRYRALGKPMWVTEIACSDWQSPERLSAEGQMAYMKEAIPLLEADEDVERYAWFSYFKDEWAHPIVDGENGDAGLVHPNGTLTPLGQLYNTFASGTNLTEINITEPENTTSSTTSTAFRGPMTTSVSTSTPTTTGSHTTSGTSSTSRSFTGTGTTSASTITATISPSATPTSTGSSTFTETSKTLTTTTTGTSTTPSSTTFASSTLAVTAVTSTATRISTTQTTRVKAATTAASPTGTTSSSVLTDTWSTSSSKPSELVETASTTGGTSGTGTMMSSASSASTTPSPATTQGSMLTSSTNEGPSTSTDEENVTNQTEPAIEVLSCTQAVDAWCHSDPSSAPFFPLQHCPDWRLHDAMCSSPSVANNAPQFAGTTELEKGSFPALFLLLAVLGAAMAGAVLASLFYRQKGHYILCCRRQKEDPEDLKRAISGKLDWQGNAFLPVLCNTGASARVAPEPGLFLPMEAVARRVASSPHASEGLCEGSPVIGTLSKKALGPDVAIGTPVGVTPASRAAALTTLTEAMARATCPDVSLDEREIAIHQAGRVLSSKAVLNLPLALRQEAEVWHSRQEERLNLAKSMEAVVDRASSLEEAAGEAHPADPLRALLSRAMIADKDGPEAVLADWARRASAFEEKLDEQRLRLERRSLPGDQSLLTAADLMELTADLTEMQTKASKELIELQDLRNPRAGEDWKTARNSLESKWMQFVEDSRAAVEETKSALAANRTAKILTSDTEREAALAEAARRQATFQEELQKQRQKLQKRTKAKSAAPTPLELGRLVEDEHLLQALEADRDAAMKECQQFIDAGKAENLGEETSEWTNLLEGWHAFGQDLAKLASHNQDSREAMPNIWAAAAAKAKLGKVDVNHTEQLALLAEGARCAAAFDEELQKQRQQMKRRRKALQKHGGAEQATDVLDACRAISDEEALKELVKEQAEAHAKCQAMACSGEGASEAWEQLAATWAQMEKDIAKAEKEVSEAAKAITNEASSSLVQALGLVQAEVARDVEDGSTQRRAALQEAARRIAVFEEELSKQRAAIRRRRAENPQGASALGCALLDGEAIAALAAKCADGQAACQAAAEEACQGTGEAEHWKDLLQLWDRLRQDLEEDMEQAAVEAKACRAEEASEALAAAGLPAAVRKALDFEHELAKLTHGCHGVSKTCSELQRAQRLASVDRMRVTQASGLAFCQEKVASAGGGQAMPHMVECRDAWQELVGLWQGLGKDLETAAQELAPTELPSLWRKLLDTSVSEAERQTVLAEAARCAAQFDEELQRQRQRLVRRKKVPMENVADRLLAFGDAIELKALAAEQEAAKSACECKLTEAAAKNNVDEAQTWKEVINVYMALDEVLDTTKKEVDVNGSFSARPDVDVGQHMVHSVIRDQKRSAASCLQVVEQAMKKDHGPLEELIEAQQAPSSMKSSGGLTNRSRQGVAQVQTWDVLDAAKGLLDSFKDTSGGTAKNMETLRQLGEEASKQIQQISDSHAPEENIQEKPPMQDFGCQTVFRLGGMAWHADPAIQRLLEDLTKVSLQTMDVADQSHLDKLDLEVTRTFNQWRNEFIGKRRETSLAASRSRSRSGAATEVSAAPESVSAKLHAEVKADHVQEKQVETPALQSSSLKPDEVQLAADSANFSKSPPLESNKVLDDSEIGIRRTKQSSGRRASSPGHLPPSRLTYSESRRPLPGSANSDAEDKPTSRPRRRRSLSRDDSSGVARTDLSLPLGQLPLEPEPRKEEPQHQEPYQKTQAEVFQNDDLLVHLERKLSGSQPLSAFSEHHHDSKKAVHASTALDGPGGPGDGSLLVPPSLSNVSRSLSPASSIGSSQSPGHVPRRLDPIVRPRGPPLPSAGRLLLASQESPADSAKSSPRSGL